MHLVVKHEQTGRGLRVRRATLIILSLCVVACGRVETEDPVATEVASSEDLEELRTEIEDIRQEAQDAAAEARSDAEDARMEAEDAAEEARLEAEAARDEAEQVRQELEDATLLR